MHAGVLEFLAKLHVHGLAVNPTPRRAPDALIASFYQRKHGSKTTRVNYR